MKLLTQLIDQFQAKHGRLPRQILVHPEALVVLAARQSVGPVWNGIQVRCVEISPGPVAGPVQDLGIVIHEGAVQGLDLG